MSANPAAESPGLTPPRRDWQADYLKAAAIVAVVLIHTGFPYKLPLRFCVPAFVAIWAYYVERALLRRSPSDGARYLKGRFASISVIYLFWTAIYLAVYYPHAADWASTPWQKMLNVWLGGFGFPGQYFLLVLLQLTLLFPLLRRLVNRRSAALLIGGFALLNVLAGYTLFSIPVIADAAERPFIYWLAYAFFGIACARSLIPRVPSLFIFGVLLLAMSPLEEDVYQGLSPRASQYLTLLVTFGTFLVLLAIAPRPETAAAAKRPALPGWLNHAVIYVGQNTMGIFMLHNLALQIEWHWIRSGNFVYQAATASIGQTVVAIVFALAVTQALKWLRLGFLVR